MIDDDKDRDEEYNVTTSDKVEMIQKLLTRFHSRNIDNVAIFTNAKEQFTVEVVRDNEFRTPRNEYKIAKTVSYVLSCDYVELVRSYDFEQFTELCFSVLGTIDFMTDRR